MIFEELYGISFMIPFCFYIALLPVLFITPDNIQLSTLYFFNYMPDFDINQQKSDKRDEKWNKMHYINNKG